eukprot:GGOE01015352.1.p1 GENE.GGOE01015352.1~~GGOE01015352.1.p1  ORF type:complete len:1036 (+),score=210.65 GGOE01015352.1:55-3162(+)
MSALQSEQGQEPPAKKSRASGGNDLNSSLHMPPAVPDDSLQQRDFWDDQLVEGRQVASSSSAPRAQDWSPDVLREQIVGFGQSIQTPFGDRQLVYADYTASGRLLRNVEAFLQDQVMPLYGNTHTTTSMTGLQSTCFRVESRQIIAQAVNARYRDHDEHSDVVIFAGAGTTAAVNKLVHLLRIAEAVRVGQRCVLFTGPHEHHSNLLPWREVPGLEVCTVEEDDRGRLNVEDLAQKLATFQHYDRKWGSFAAASNVTGVLADVDAVTALLHRHGALAFWDFATAAAHLSVDMNPAADPLYAKDAIFLSPHKLLGGPGSPGVLVVKRKLLQTCPVPSQPGGGTVFFVTENSHTYLRNAEEREEGGTPDVLGSVRAGCAFHVRSMAGPTTIECIDHTLSSQFLNSLAAIPNLTVLGPAIDIAPRLPIASVVIRTPWDQHRYLHHSFLCAVLNDVFGIQVRGGCMCAGPYSLRLLGIPNTTAQEFETELASKNNEPIRPGYVRVSLQSTTSSELQYIVEALEQVASHGWALLPQYRFSSRTGEWRHATLLTRFPTRRWLSRMPTPSDSSSSPSSSLDSVSASQTVLPLTTGEFHRRLKMQLQEAKALLVKAVADCPSGRNPSDTSLEEPFAHHLRWFALPSEAVRYARGQPLSPATAILRPREYKEGSVPVDAPSGSTLATTPESATNQACALRVLSMPAVVEHRRPPKKLMRLIGEAVRDFDLIQNGDRLLLGLSGGKDSLCLLHCLMELQKRAPIKFSLAGATVNPGVEASFNPRPLIQYMQQLAVPYHFLETSIYEDAQSGKMDGDSICSFCSRMRRGSLYTCCREHGYNKLVLAQHLDDLAESFFMSAMRNGQVRTMKAKYVIEAGDLVVIRPLVYVRETLNREFAYNSGLPVINENCPACFEVPKERARVKKMLAKEETEFSGLFHSLRRALRPLMLEEVHEVHRTAAETLERIRSLHTRYSSQPAKGKEGDNAAASGEAGATMGGSASSDAEPADADLRTLLREKDATIRRLQEQLAMAHGTQNALSTTSTG